MYDLSPYLIFLLIGTFFWASLGARRTWRRRVFGSHPPRSAPLAWFGMMTITRRSPVSGTWQTMPVHVTNRQLLQWQQGEISLADVQPPLTVAERRFLETGRTPEDDAAVAVLE